MRESKEFLLGLLGVKNQQHYIQVYQIVDGEPTILSEAPIGECAAAGFDIGIRVMPCEVPGFHSEEESGEWDRLHLNFG